MGKKPDRMMIAISKKTHDRLKKEVDEVGWKLGHAADLAIKLWLDSMEIKKGGK